MIKIFLYISHILVGQDKGKHKTCNLDFAVKTIDVIDEVLKRRIRFKDGHEFDLYTNMFAEHPS